MKCPILEKHGDAHCAWCLEHPDWREQVGTLSPCPEGQTAATIRRRGRVGVGTVLKRRLAAVGIVAGPGCSCNAMAARMDQEGPAWCREHIGEILDMMRAEAGKRRLPFVEAGARLLVLLAIRVAEHG